MGMYDMICGDQVKCFYRYFEFKDEIRTTSGDLRRFRIGDKVPYRTSWYNYTKNFNIINLWDTLLEDGCADVHMLIGVRNGKVNFVKPLAQANETDWKNIQRCIDYRGEWLRIFSQAEALDYAEAKEKYEQMKVDYMRNKMPYREKTMDLLYGIAVVDEEEKRMRLTELASLEDAKKREYEEFVVFDENARKELIDKFERNVKPERVLKKEEEGAAKNMEQKKRKREQSKQNM